ncbi:MULTISPECIES: Sapep family Mn(2+)-dependent dipeptidase [unclassified Adlercreutzia]|uniref:Sapep family Mn(2+)-dependent dipeptidase n=1 Tax=unclassified Adlercreutzia TaxID=2636013 RepID=UPI0013EA043A|nr:MULTISPECIES: Sapep family Mn(2+)-dependent dipeptidase [unclassified Adlercreutzia]
MERNDVMTAADKYVEENWPTMLEDITTLVRIPSFEDLGAAAPGAPFGPGPRAALDAVLGIASDMGFATSDVDGYMGFADLEGTAGTQIGIIGHMDVVPAGPGWSFEPYDVTVKEGCLVGRGVLDDKGPSVVALHAMRFLAGLGLPLRHTVRFLFGANEESGMGDVPYYRARYADPTFLFTPDAEFPVCYGEKGGFDARITSAPLGDGAIVEFEGGAATNAVPGQAHAVVRADAASLPPAERLTVTPAGPGLTRIEAAGKSAHAAMPETGVNAIALIVDYLLENALCNEAERAFLAFDQRLLSATDGSGVGIATSDDYFGPLTVIGGTIALSDGRLVQTMDSRFPTSITPEGITAALTALTDPIGAEFERTLLMEPFLVEPDTPEIQALLAAYNDVTGESREAFTIGGGTYAREFTRGASFGPEMPWLEMPAWAGGIHGPDETVSIAQLQTAFKIYALALFDLQQLDLG